MWCACLYSQHRRQKEASSSGQPELHRKFQDSQRYIERPRQKEVIIRRVLPALLDHLVNVELKGSHQDVVQWFWAALTSKKHVQAGLWKGTPSQSPSGSRDLSGREGPDCCGESREELFPKGLE